MTWILIVVLAVIHFATPPLSQRDRDRVLHQGDHARMHQAQKRDAQR